MTDTSPPPALPPGPQPNRPTTGEARVRIVGDGTWQGTHVELDDGTPLRGVTSVLLRVEAPGITTAIITVRQPQLDLLLDAQLHPAPASALAIAATGAS